MFAFCGTGQNVLQDNSIRFRTVVLATRANLMRARYVCIVMAWDESWWSISPYTV